MCDFGNPILLSVGFCFLEFLVAQITVGVALVQGAWFRIRGFFLVEFLVAQMIARAAQAQGAWFKI